MLEFIVNILVATAVLYNIHIGMKADKREKRKFFKHYFIVMAMLLATTNALGFILSKIPYYLFFKLFLMGWLSIPYGTGPRFIYNVYIRNIHQLFEGDIDSVINNFKKYYSDLKERYDQTVNKMSKGGEVTFGFKRSRTELSLQHGATEAESSEVDPSSAAEETEGKLEENLKVD